MPGRTAPKRWTRRPLISSSTFLERRRIATLDITGGAPELNANFRRLVTAARDMGVKVMDRHNLTVQEQPGQEDLPEFLAAHQVEIVASMPCYLQDNVDKQRGKGVYRRLGPCAATPQRARLRARGIGLTLNLVYNPLGPSLPPPQAELEADYKRVLGERFGIVFNNLFTLANMPIQRFGAILLSQGQFDALSRHAAARASRRKSRWRDVPQPAVGRLSRLRLRLRFQPDARSAADARRRERVHLSDLLDDDIADNPIRVAGHCFGCTAGQGSSCGGALKEAAE